MKRLFALICSILFCFFLFAGCDSQQPLESTEPTEPTETFAQQTVTVKPGSNSEKHYMTFDPDKVTYEDYYVHMTADEQAQFINSFDSYDAFFEWDAKAKADYHAGMGEITPDGIILPATEPSLTKPAD